MNAYAPPRPVLGPADRPGVGPDRSGAPSSAASDGTGAPRTRRGDGRTVWRAGVVVVAAAVVLPVALVAVGLVTPSSQAWDVLAGLGVGRMVATTLALTTSVVLGATALGAGLAWLVARHRFPGSRWFAWLLVLPLAVPAYVLGFVYVGLLDHPGPVQSTLRAVAGGDVSFPPVRSFPVAVAVLVLALYPYPYLLARAALAEQSATTYEAARVLGASPLRAARRVVLPLARPSLAAAGALVAMETLTDFATVQYFGVTTVSVGVHQVWTGLYDREAAAQLAGLVLLFAVAVLAFERAGRGRARFAQQGGAARGLPTTVLSGRRRLAATAGCGAVLGVAFVVPVAQLLAWTTVGPLRGEDGGLDARYLGHLGNSVALAALAALLCAAVGLGVACASRLGGGRSTPWLARLATVGYAVPGPVVAIGVLVLLSGVASALSAAGLPGGRVLVSGTLVGVVYAYVVRFLAPAWSSIDASLDKVSPSLTSAALSLGARPLEVVRRVHLPLVRPGVGVALVLVAVDAMKELPVVLLLRPFGFETLSIWVFQLATESRWESAGLPALTIVAVALVPVVLLFRRTLAAPEVLGAAAAREDAAAAVEVSR